MSQSAHPPPTPDSVASRSRWDRERITSITRDTTARIRTNRVNLAAGAFAYRWFLAIFPIIIALLGVATLITVPKAVVVSLIRGVARALPSSASQVFTQAITHATTRASADVLATVFASVVALWSATSGMVIVEEGLDIAFGLTSDRSFLAKRYVAVPLLLGATVLGGAASALVIFGPQLGTLIRDHAPIGGTLFSATWTVVRWTASLGLMNLLISLIYYLAPNRPRRRWRWTSAGALVATLAWALISLGFSFFTVNFGSYGRTYGAFAGVAILIFWLDFTGLAILVGGEINAAIERSTTSPPSGGATRDAGSPRT